MSQGNSVRFKLTPWNTIYLIEIYILKRRKKECRITQVKCKWESFVNFYSKLKRRALLSSNQIET